MKTITHTTVKIAAITKSGSEYSPAPKIIGIGPIRRIKPRESFNPEKRAAKTKMIVPINIKINPRRNSFIKGI